MNGLPLDHQLPPLPSPATDELLPSKSPAPVPGAHFPPSSQLSSKPLALPASPVHITLDSPASPFTPDQKPRKSNPLNDLIDTEKQYVDQLTGVIRKVAAAWSRSNLPPHDLDTMFRSIEVVYKANRGLYTKLKEIGTNPSSPKALGDLLMRWIDDLKTPYTTYCTKYCSGFDIWEPVQSNPKLAPALMAFSTTCPPPSSSVSGTWTLDDLFLLPKARLKYYKKLYNRLLKTTEPGRSDHRLLVGALDTLEFLIGVVESRGTILAGSPEIPHSPPADFEDEVVIDTRSKDLPPVLPSAMSTTDFQPILGSEASSPPEGSASERNRTSQEAENTNGVPTQSMSLSDLERRLNTDRTMDIFTLKPKVVNLHMNPPTLTFTREINFSTNVVVRFVPRHGTEEIVHPQAHIFLLSDLFLLCDRMSPEELAQYAPEGADMWLSYPPLAGKVLRVTEEGEGHALQVAIMRKEFLTIEFPSVECRSSFSRHLKECIEFSSSLPPPAKSPPPPVPPINPMFLNRAEPPDSRRTSPISRVASPQSSHSSLGASARPSSDNNLVESMNRLRMDGPSPSIGPPASHPGLSAGEVHPPRSYPNNSSFGVPPPARNSSFASLPPRGLPGHGQQSPVNMERSMLNSRGPPPHPMGPPQSGGLPPHPTSASAHPMNPPPHSMSHAPHPMSPPPHSMIPPQHSMIPPQHSMIPPHMMHAQLPRPPPMQIPNGPMPGGLPRHPNPVQGGPSSAPPRSGPYGQPPGAQNYSPFAESQMQGFGARKTPSTRSLSSQYAQNDQPLPAPPLPSFHDGLSHSMSRNGSFASLPAPPSQPLLPSANVRSVSVVESSFDAPSPPGSPVPETPQVTGPLTSTVSAQMKCKVFLQQQHAQWKSLGSGKLKLYRQDVTNIKQLVIEGEDKNRTILVSTIVLTDGVERVGKTGVAIELSDHGARTGVIYMIQLRNETSAGGLFDSLLAGSDRSK